MRKYFLLSLKCLPLIVIILGCAALQVKREVQENTFVSSNPNLVIKVSPEYQYVGDINKDSTSTAVDGTRELRKNLDNYCFIKHNKDRVEKAVVIQIQTIETYFVSDFLRNVKDTLAKGSSKYGGKPFQYFVKATHPSMNSVITGYIVEQGYNMQFGLTKVFGRVYGAKGDTLVSVLYFEAVDQSEFDDRSWKNADDLSSKQIEFLKDFNERANSAFELIS